MARVIFGLMARSSRTRHLPSAGARVFSGRHVFYLVTKALARGKPTYATLRASLGAMRRRCVADGVALVR